MQEIVYLIMTEGNFEEAKKLNILQRGPFLEMKTPDHDGVELVKSAKRPRQMKTHLQYRFLERTFQKEKPRVIVVMRNLKVSFRERFQRYHQRHFHVENEHCIVPSRFNYAALFKCEKEIKG